MAALAITPWSDDEDLIAGVASDGRPRLRISVPRETTVVLGRGSAAEAEIDTAACAADGVDVTRRRGGGCAVVLDPGNLVVSAALPVPGIGDSPAYFARFSAWLGAALGRLGAPGVRQRGISDLALDERKVGGSCIYRSKGLLYYSTTLLVAPDLDRMERYLRHPPREPEYRRGRRHRDFVSTLASRGLDEPPEELATALREHLDLALL